MSEPAEGPELVPGPVGPVDEYDATHQATAILSDLKLADIYSERRGTILKVAVDRRHTELFTEFKQSKPSDNMYADCASLDGAQYKRRLPTNAYVGKSETHMFKDHLVSKSVSQACLSVRYDKAHLDSHGVLIVLVDTIIDEPIRFAYHEGSDSCIIVSSTDIDALAGYAERRSMLLKIAKRIGDATVPWVHKPGSDVLHNVGLVDYESVRVRNPVAPKNPAPKGKDKGEWGHTHARFGKDKGEWGHTHAQYGKGPGFGKDFGRHENPWDWEFPELKGFGKSDPYWKGFGKFDPFGKSDWYGKNFGKFDGFGKDYGKFDGFGKDRGKFDGFGKSFEPRDTGKAGKSKDSDPIGKGEWNVIQKGEEPKGLPPVPPKIFTLGAEYLESESLKSKLSDPRVRQGCFVSCLTLRDKNDRTRPTKDETGLDTSLQDKLQRQAGFTELRDQARQTLEEYGCLVLWCRHGFHRSAGIAEIVRNEFAPNARCIHLTIHRHRDRYRNGGKPDLWARKDPKTPERELDAAMNHFIKEFPAGQGAGAELQEQLYRAELEKAEAQARIRVLEKRLSESKGDGSPGSAVSVPPKGDANPGGSVIVSAGPTPAESVQKDPRETAEKFLSQILKESKFQYMRSEGLYAYSTEKKVFMCSLCDRWDADSEKYQPICPVTEKHLESSDHLEKVAWHFYKTQGRESAAGNRFWQLCKRDEWHTVNKRPKTHK